MKKLAIFLVALTALLAAIAIAWNCALRALGWDEFFEELEEEMYG